jgi:molecular chaperone HscB
MKLDDDDFTLFALPQRMAQDRAAIDARWRQLQAEAHPDRFAAQGAAAQRIATQWAVRINEGHRRLKDPLSRGAYLCELRGVAIDAERNTAMPSSFLVQQMQWREALDEAHTLADVQRIDDEVLTLEKRLTAELQRLLDETNDTAAAAAQVRALMFVQRFRRDIDARLEALETSTRTA